MEKLQKPQDVYIRQRRWATIFFTLLSLVFLACVIILPIAFSVHPPEHLGVSYNTVLILLCVFACVLGLPLAFVFVALVIKLRHTFVIYADEKGMYLNSTIVPYGFIPWDNVKEIEYYGVFDLNTALLAPDTNHLKITLRSKQQFVKGLNFIQRAYFRLNFSRLFCNLSLCKGKGADIGSALRTALQYYSLGKNVAEL